MTESRYKTKLSFNDWIQTVTGIADLIGLILVVWELRQARELTLAQLVSDHWAVRSEHHSTLMGDDNASSMEKACMASEQLGWKDTQILNNYFHSMLLPSNRMNSISNTGSFYNQEDIDGWATGSFPTIFGFPYGRYWWRNIRTFYEGVNPAIAEIGDSILAQTSEEYSCDSYLNGFLESLVD